MNKIIRFLKFIEPYLTTDAKVSTEMTEEEKKALDWKYHVLNLDFELNMLKDLVPIFYAILITVTCLHVLGATEILHEVFK